MSIGRLVDGKFECSKTFVQLRLHLNDFIVAYLEHVGFDVKIVRAPHKNRQTGYLDPQTGRCTLIACPTLS